MGIAEQKIGLDALKDAVFGHYPRVARKAKVDKATVARVLKGEWVNKKVLRAAQEVRKELDREKKKDAKEISKILAS
jgi:hypothetical protein